MNSKQWKAIAASLLLAASLFPGNALTPAAADVRRFDLGANTQNGWTSVSASEGYSSGRGYGFSGSGVKDVGASGKNELSDAVQFTDWATTFNVDLPKGLYRIKVTLGNTSRTSVYMEDMLQIVNMTGNHAVDEILLPITDGQLNIRAGAGKSGTAFSISAVEIEKVSDDPTLPPTIWLCGDSTVCNYYPLDTSVQGGWGQMLGAYVDKGWNIRNMAASGQYAKGFLDAGQFTPIETYGKGDYLFIQFGHNDEKTDETQYPGLGTYPGLDWSTLDQTGKDAQGRYSYEYLLAAYYINLAKNKGAVPVLVTPITRLGMDGKPNYQQHTAYRNAMLTLGRQFDVAVIDMTELTTQLYTNLYSAGGLDETRKLHCYTDAAHSALDYTHLSGAGAWKIAQMIAEQTKENGLTIGEYVK